MSERPPGAIRVMTWNIHGGVGTDGRFALDRIIEVINRNDPDVVALQEVDSRRRRQGYCSPFALLREAVGEHGVDAISIVTADGDYGQMLMSRWPVSGTEIHDLTHRNREPRRAIETEVHTAGGDFRLVAAHFGLNIAERRTQARRLVAIARQHPMMTVMLGDFNEWFWPGSLLQASTREFPARTRHATFRLASRSYVSIVFSAGPRAAIMRSFVDRQARMASDRLPVIADIVFDQTAT